MASIGRVDVHRLHIEFMRHLAGQVRRGDATSHVSEYYVAKTSENFGAARVGAELRHLPSAVDRLER